MRGEVTLQTSMFSYVDLESRIPTHHPIRQMRKVIDKALLQLEPFFDGMYSQTGRPSIPPEQLL
ncbi:MAG: transposase, partial [Gammaproteobacteria bacterium BRH_c0]